MRTTILVAVLAMTSLAAAQTLSSDVKQFVKVDAPIIALTHVRVIDGTGAPAREDQTKSSFPRTTRRTWPKYRRTCAAP